MRTEIKSPLGSGTYCFRKNGQICHLLSQLYLNEANKPEYGQLCIFDSAEATTKRLENQSNQRCMAEVMQQQDEMLQQVNPLAESHKQMYPIK
jgi:hypothetical protein